MSQYVEFYFTTPEVEKPIWLEGFSRNSVVYDVAKDLGFPYEKGQELTVEDFYIIMDSLKDKTTQLEDYITGAKERKEAIKTFNNSIEEKLTALNELDNDINEAKNALSEVTYATYFFKVLRAFVLDKDKRKLYAGIEWNGHLS